jgi:hypothetical protein
MSFPNYFYPNAGFGKMGSNLIFTLKSLNIQIDIKNIDNNRIK